MRMPLDPYAAARPVVASISAAFAAPPGRCTGVATLPPMPMMLTMTPRLRASMRFSTASVGWIVLKNFASIASCQACAFEVGGRVAARGTG